MVKTKTDMFRQGGRGEGRQQFNYSPSSALTTIPTANFHTKNCQTKNL